jgi:adenosylhomocysteine nucleosidase
VSFQVIIRVPEKRVKTTRIASVSEIPFEDPCVAFAMRREARPFRREFRPQQRFPGAPCWAKFCGPAWLSVLVLETGVGRERTERAAAWLLGRPKLGNLAYRPKVVVSAGFCGALADGLGVGDVVLATEVVDTAGNCWPATWPGELPPGPWRPPLHRGRLVSVPQLVSTPAQKQALGLEHGALAVDMEAATLAEWCRRAQVPFGCVRAVSDDATTALSPRLAALVSAGRVSPWRLALAVVCRPGLTGEMWRLAKQTRLAAQQLGKAVGELLTLTLPWAAD